MQDNRRKTSVFGGILGSKLDSWPIVPVEIHWTYDYFNGIGHRYRLSVSNMFLSSLEGFQICLVICLELSQGQRYSQINDHFL